MHGWFNSQLVNLIGVRATVTQLAGWLVGWWGTWLVGGWVNELEGWVDVPGHRGAADSQTHSRLCTAWSALQFSSSLTTLNVSVTFQK